MHGCEVGIFRTCCYNAAGAETRNLAQVATVSTPNESPPLKDPFTAAVLAWLVPGLGHVYQGRTIKGIVFFLFLMGTFVAGMYLGEWKTVYWSWDPDRKPIV